MTNIGNNRSVAWATWGLVIVTTFLAIYTYKLWQATGNLVTDTKNNSKMQLRAYLSAMPTNLTLVALNTPKIKFEVTNHGQTPASKVSSNAKIYILPYPLPKDYPFPEMPPPRPFPKSVIHPKNHLDLKVWSTFSSTEIESAIIGTQFRIYIFGVVDYVDVFKESQRTTFCYSIVGDENLRAVAEGTPIPAEAKNLGEPCEQYNEAT